MWEGIRRCSLKFDAASFRTLKLKQIEPVALPKNEIHIIFTHTLLKTEFNVQCVGLRQASHKSNYLNRDQCMSTVINIDVPHSDV